MTSSAKTSRAASPTAEQQLKSFIDKFEPKHQTVIRSVRKFLRRRFPTANEIVYDNYNFFVIGYSPTERPSDTIVSIAGGTSVGSIADSTIARTSIRPATTSATRSAMASEARVRA